MQLMPLSCDHCNHCAGGSIDAVTAVCACDSKEEFMPSCIKLLRVHHSTSSCLTIFGDQGIHSSRLPEAPTAVNAFTLLCKAACNLALLSSQAWMPCLHGPMIQDQVCQLVTCFTKYTKRCMKTCAACMPLAWTSTSKLVLSQRPKSSDSGRGQGGPVIGVIQVDPLLDEANASCPVGAEAGPLSPQASAARPPLARDSSQALPRVSSTERLQATGTPGKLPQAKAQPVQLKPGHKVGIPHPCSTVSSRGTLPSL